MLKNEFLVNTQTWIVHCSVLTRLILHHLMSELWNFILLCNCLLTSFVNIRNPNESSGYFVSHGVLYNKNTIEDFKDCDKVALMNDEGQKIWESVTNGKCIENPSLFVRFFVLSFAVSTYQEILFALASLISGLEVHDISS